MSTELEIFAQIAEIDEKLAQNRSEETQLKEKRRALEEQALEIMSVSGLDKITVNGRTVYCAQNVVAKLLQDRQMVAEALAKHGFASMVKYDYNTRSLNALIKEFLDEGGIPEELSKYIEPCYISQIRSRKA
jgi:hypothetical protein